MSQLTTEPHTHDCPKGEITAFIDGELSADELLDLESHLASCAACRIEVNQQKSFLAAINSSLRDSGEFPLPGDFTKRVVANAESTVSGLRRPRERMTAVFICAALFIFAIFALGSDADKVLSGTSALFERTAAILGFAAHSAYNIALGAAVVGRSLLSRTAAGVIAAVVTALFMIVGAGFIFNRPAGNSERER